MGRFAHSRPIVRHRPGSMPTELWMFLGFVVFLWIASIGAALARFHVTHNLRRSFGIIALEHPGFDFRCYFQRMQFLHHSGFFAVPGFPWNYPAPCIFLYSFFYSFAFTGGRGLYVFLSLGGVVFVVALYRFSLALQRGGLSRGVSLGFLIPSLLLSWPIYFAVQRGNIELFLWFGVTAGVYFYLRGQWWLAAASLGAIAAFKLYPILLLALFLPARRYKELAAALLVFAVVTLTGLAYLDPHVLFTFHEVQAGVQHFVAMYTLGPLLGYDHSLFSLLKFVEIAHPAEYPVLLHRYMFIIGLLMAILFLARIWRMPRLNQVLFLILAMVMLPPTSFDYTLQSLYIPWALLILLAVSAARSGQRLRGFLSAMICFGILFGPETFLQYDHIFFGGQIKALALIALTAIASIVPFPEDTLELRSPAPSTAQAAIPDGPRARDWNPGEPTVAP